MKKISLTFFMIFLCFDAIAKDKLSWGMDSKKIRKKVTIEKSYTNDFCEILFLPKNSVFQNEYDEYLLFSKEDGLISRLQKTDMAFEYEGDNYKHLIRSDYMMAATHYLEDKLGYFQEFPSELSFEVLFSLSNIYDYKNKPFGDYRVSFLDYEDYYLININGIEYIKKVYSYIDTPIGSSPKYSNFISSHENEIELLRTSLENYIESTQKEERENAYSKNPGPFGTWWGMKSTDMKHIGKCYQNGSSGYGFSRDIFEEFFCAEEKLMHSNEIKPEKSNEKIHSYTAIFDENDSLFQIVCVVSDATAIGLRDVGEQTYSMNNKFKEMKMIIESKYGNGQELKNRGEACLRWKDPTGQNIELLQNSSIYQNYYGAGGLHSYIWLVYSAPNYDIIKEKIESYKENKAKEEKRMQIEEEQKQNSYF